MRFLLAISLLAFLAMSSPCGFAGAAPADLDLRYGHHGIVKVANPVPKYERWYVRDGAVAADGSLYLVVAGCVESCRSSDYFVVRYGPDGKSDHSFGGGAVKSSGRLQNRTREFR